MSYGLRQQPGAEEQTPLWDETLTNASKGLVLCSFSVIGEESISLIGSGSCSGN